MNKIAILLILITSFALSSARFKDIPLNHWARPYVEEISELGIISGYADNTFRGRKPLTRYDLAVFIAKYNRFIEDKYNLLLAGIGETEVREPNMRGRSSAKLDLLEEMEEELWNLRNDIRILEKNGKATDSNDKYLISFSLDSLAAFDYKNPDVLRTTGKLSFQKEIDDLSLGAILTAGDLNTNSDYTGLELNLSGFYTFPMFDTIYFGLQKGPGELMSSYGEIIDFMGDEISLKAHAIPIKFTLAPVTTSTNTIALRFEESLAISKVLINFSWDKRYLYKDRMSNLIKANGILDNKDVVAITAEMNDIQLTSQWGIGVNNNAYYLLKASFPSYKDSLVTIKKYTSKPNAYQSSMGDTYTANGALDIYNKAIENGSTYFSLDVANFFNVLYGATDVKYLSGQTYYKTKVGLKLKVSKNLTVIKEGRYSKDPVKGQNIAILMYLSIDL